MRCLQLELIECSLIANYESAKEIRNDNLHKTRVPSFTQHIQTDKDGL